MSELTKRVRAKYPGAYDDLDDAALEKAVLAKHPEYADLAQPEQKGATEPPAAKEPSFVDNILADNAALPPMLRATQGALRLAKAHPVQTGALAGGLLAAPLTGAASIPAAMAASGLGAGLGAGAGQLASGQRPDLKTMATEAAAGAAGEGIGRGAAEVAKLAGRGLYRAGLLPINQILGKYGDIVKTGVEEMVPVTQGGLQKAQRIKGARIATKKTALADADQRVTFRASAIADDARVALGGKAHDLTIAGEGNPSGAFDARLNAFTANNPDGVLSPSRLESIKSTLDDRNGAAYMKMRKREPLTPREESRMQLTHAASRAQESVVPGYRDMNKGIMDASGLEKTIARRVNGSGANQGLENAMTMLGGISALPARLAMLPPVLSGAGMGVYQAGKYAAAPAATSLKAALIALLAPEEEK